MPRCAGEQDGVFGERSGLHGNLQIVREEPGPLATVPGWFIFDDSRESYHEEDLQQPTFSRAQ
jgi:hypothetical protein